MDKNELQRQLEQVREQKRQQEAAVKQADQELKKLQNAMRREQRKHEKGLLSVMKTIEKLYGEDVPEDVSTKRLVGIINTVNSRLQTDQRETPIKDIFKTVNRENDQVTDEDLPY